MVSVALTGRIERTRPLSKVLPKCEARDEGVLHGLARCNVVPCHPALIRPCQDSVARQLAALSLTTIFGLPRSITSRSSSRATSRAVPDQVGSYPAASK